REEVERAVAAVVDVLLGGEPHGPVEGAPGRVVAGPVEGARGLLFAGLSSRRALDAREVVACRGEREPPGREELLALGETGARRAPREQEPRESSKRKHVARGRGPRWVLDHLGRAEHDVGLVRERREVLGALR